MSESLLQQLEQLELYLLKEEKDNAKNLVFRMITTHPEDDIGYFFMAYYYSVLRQKEEAIRWIDEAVQRAPEKEAALAIAAGLYYDFSLNDLKRNELVETGLRLYPDNHFFHGLHAQINEQTNKQAASIGFLSGDDPP
ncbi:hypothetical protein SAMN05421736_10657 [Evansella caseinilytica]|uniref:Tetratricopeptide repeat protein n=1 Tax=Evansella caseinilytica TaxID=1503961 RepID=A0A1H3Q7R7_9BACI|nr:hypothetical protein [Evansella caseinilytica]SDZ09582.1 hypothetical protein SAMN05421736_10657 [Evansella caseinilytica]